ncbi:flavodoxin family protein [Streptomyces neyagawaensis]|uniref:flavodoxin family protein n=1 Tax=Streptomyces neyagawaensis TaxID=42238 RepID=UPI0006E2A874|nr:flavodoxin domain-containing protein [Streptomyces neyagawaensis]
MSSLSRPAVAFAFHSGYDHTAVIAEAVARGAAQSGAEVISTPVDTITDEQWVQLDAADAIIFGASTYMGTDSAAFHTFAEAGSKRWYTQTWADKIAAGFTNSGAKNGDKSLSEAVVLPGATGSFPLVRCRGGVSAGGSDRPGPVNTQVPWAHTWA